MASIATDRQVGREELEAFIAERRRAVFVTTRRDGRPQMSLVALGIFEGDLMIASYPDRVKSLNADRNPQVSAMIMGEKFMTSGYSRRERSGHGHAGCGTGSGRLLPLHQR